MLSTAESISARSGGMFAAEARERRLDDEVTRRGIVLAIHAAAVGVVATTLFLGNSDSLVLYVGGAVMGPTHLALAFLEARSSYLRLSPLSYYFAWMAIGLGPSAIFVAQLFDAGLELKLGFHAIRSHDVALGYVIYICGAWCFHSGIQLTRPTALPQPVAAPTNANKFLVLWAAAFALRALRVDWSIAAVYGLGTLSALVGYGTTRAIAGRLDARAWCIVIVGTLIEFVFGVRSGMKGQIMLSLLPAIWPLIIVARLRRWLLPVAALATLLYFGLVYPVVGAMRTSASDEARDDPVATFYSLAMDSSAEEAVADSDPLDAFLERHFDPVSIAWIHGEVDRRGLLEGSELEYVLTSFVPRFLWPEKPAVTRGRWFDYYLGMDDSPDDPGTSIGLSAAGELYWNFGISGVVTGMFILGTIIGALWRIATGTPLRDPLTFLLYTAVLVGVTDLAEAGTKLISLVHLFLVLGLPVLLLRRRVSAERADGAEPVGSIST